MDSNTPYHITQIAKEAGMSVGQLFDQLAERGITSPGAIADELGVTPQAVRYQLQQLGYTVKNIRVTRVVTWSKSDDR